VQLVRVPTDGGKPQLLGRVPVTMGGETFAHHQVILSACVGGDTVFIGTHQDGILALPLGGGAGRKLELELPSTRALALAWLGGKLYAYLDGGYLVAINVESGSFTTLASSRRREQRSPFDDAEVFEVPFLTADPERGRLLFLALQPPPKDAAGRKGTTGLWEYDAGADRFAQLLEAIPRMHPGMEGVVLRFGTAPRQGKLLLGSFEATIEFDATTNKARLLRCGKVSPVPALRPDTAVVKGSPGPFGVVRLLHDGWLWSFTGTGLTRLALDGRLEHFPFVERNVPRLWGPEGSYFDVLGPDELLVGGAEGLALCTLTRSR
jgi:hypothetical protein